jgi:hypothetical protein
MLSDILQTLNLSKPMKNKDFVDALLISQPGRYVSRVAGLAGCLGGKVVQVLEGFGT